MPFAVIQVSSGIILRRFLRGPAANDYVTENPGTQRILIPGNQEDEAFPGMYWDGSAVRPSQPQNMARRIARLRRRVQIVYRVTSRAVQPHWPSGQAKDAVLVWLAHQAALAYRVVNSTNGQVNIASKTAFVTDFETQLAVSVARTRYDEMSTSFLNRANWFNNQATAGLTIRSDTWGASDNPLGAGGRDGTPVDWTAPMGVSNTIPANSGEVFDPDVLFAG